MLTQALQRTTRNLIGTVDRAVLERVLTPLPAAREPIESLSHTERIHALTAFAAFYDRPDHFAPATTFFSRTACPMPNERVVRRFGRQGEVVDLSWHSGFEPLWSEPAATAYFQSALDVLRSAAGSRAHAKLARSLDSLRACERRLGIQLDYGNGQPANQTMCARWFRHNDGSRPCAVILHGYLGGTLALEEHMWPVHALFERGMDVVLSVLPMHGARAGLRGRFRLPGFPAVDPRLAVEGFRQLVHEHLTLFDYLLAGKVSELGVMGMSLGGYSAALLCTLDPRLRFGLFYMPLACVADFALRTGRMTGDALEQREQAEMLERVYRCVSPLARPSLLPEDRTVVLAGEADLITGLAHGSQLVEQFGAKLCTYAGSHIMPLGRDAAFDAAWRLLGWA